MSANTSGSTYNPGYKSEHLKLSFATDQGLTWFINQALKGTNISGTLFGGGTYGLQGSYLDSLTLSLSTARVESVSDQAGGGFTASIVFSTFDFQARDLQGNGLLAAASRFGSTNTGTDTTLTASSATSTAPVSHTGVPTHFYFTANGLSGPISGGGLTNLFAADGVALPSVISGVTGSSVTSLTVTLTDAEEAIDGILSMVTSHANISLAQVLGYSAEGQVYKLSINSAHINTVDLSKPGQVTLTLDFTAATWRTIDVNDTGTPVRFDQVTADYAANTYGSSGGSIASIPAEFTPIQSGAVATPDRFFVSVGGWQGDTASGLHTGLFEAASVNLGALRNSGSPMTADNVTLTFSTQDAAARFFDAMASNATLPSVTVYESVSGPSGLFDAFQFDMANAKVSSVATYGGRTVVTISYAAFEATSYPRDASGNSISPVHYGATLSTGVSTTVADAPISNAAPTSHTDAPIAYYITIPGITGNYPLQFQNAGTVNSLVVDGFSFQGQRSGGSMAVGDISVQLSDGLIYLPKLADMAARGLNLTGAKIYGYSAQGLTYELDLTSVKISSVNPNESGVVNLSLATNQYAVHVFDRAAGTQALIDETSGYNKTGAVVSPYVEAAPADQSAFPTAQPSVTLAAPAKYYLAIAGWTGDSDSALHPGLLEIVAPSLLGIYNSGTSGSGSGKPSFSDITIHFTSLDGLANFVGALASNTHFASAGIIGAGFFNGAAEQDSLRLRLDDVSITSVDVGPEGYTASLTFGRYYLDTKGLNASGNLVSVVPGSGYDITANTSGGSPLGSSLNSQPTDGSNNAMPTSYFLQMGGVTGTFSTADTANLLPVLSYSFGLSTNGTTVQGQSVSIVLNSSLGADAEFLRLLTDGTLVSQGHVLGYNSAGQVFDLSLANLHVASVDSRSDGSTFVVLEPGSLSVKTVDLGAGDTPVRSQTAGYNFTAATATAFAQTTISSVPAPAGALNNAPISLPDSYAIDGSGSIGAVAGVLGNDNDPDGHALLAPVVTAAPAHGMVTLRSDGSFDYAVTPGFSGYDSFLYRVSDVFGALGVQTSVNLTVYLPGATAGNDTIVGTSSSDLMRGLGGNDMLDGGAGADTMSGGSGNDIYVVDNTGDVVVELAGEGTDTVLVASTLSAFILASDAQVEKLATLTPTDTTAMDLTGNTFSHDIQGNAGANELTGGSGNDVIQGFAGDDNIAGGGGADTLIGGDGNDIYRVTDSATVIVEAVGGGIDSIKTTVDYVLGAGVEVEAVRLAFGSAGRNLTGNTYSNKIVGNGNDNVLDGGGGGDTLRGNLGNDTYIVRDASDRIVEDDTDANDVVQAAVSYTLTTTAYVETLRTIDAAATTAINLTGNDHTTTIQGNAGANVLTGGAGNETISGFGGNDTLFGGGGNDIFVFASGTGQDTVGDFVSGSDKLDLSAFFSSFAQVQAAAHDVGGNAVLDLGGGNNVTLSGFLTAQLQSGDVIVSGGGGQTPLMPDMVDTQRWFAADLADHSMKGISTAHLLDYAAYEHLL
jgi:hypothetical protein